jgi:hypothetical protein
VTDSASKRPVLRSKAWTALSEPGAISSPAIAPIFPLKSHASAPCVVRGATPTAMSISAAVTRCGRWPTSRARRSSTVFSKWSIARGRCTSRSSAANRWFAFASSTSFCPGWPNAGCIRSWSRAPSGRSRNRGRRSRGCKSSSRSMDCSPNTMRDGHLPPTIASSSTSWGIRSPCIAR